MHFALTLLGPVLGWCGWACGWVGEWLHASWLEGWSGRGREVGCRASICPLSISLFRAFIYVGGCVYVGFPIGASWPPFGRPKGSPWALWGFPALLWSALGSSWRSLRFLLAPLGALWALPGGPLEASGGPMGGPWGPQNRSWSTLGAILGALLASSSPYGGIMAHFGASRWHCGVIVEPIWHIWGAFCMRFGIHMLEQT